MVPLAIGNGGVGHHAFGFFLGGQEDLGLVAFAPNFEGGTVRAPQGEHYVVYVVFAPRDGVLGSLEPEGNGKILGVG